MYVFLAFPCDTFSHSLFRSAIHFEAALKQSTTTNNADSDGKIKCDIPGCDKTYKQHSGLYYHKKHVQSFSVPSVCILSR